MDATTEMLKLVLASSSPRRRELLAEAGFEFDVVKPPIEEPANFQEGVTPAARAQALAYFKARSVAERHPNACVLGADTVVAVAGRVLGKPADRGDAESMLRTLSGTRHAVISGVAVLGPDGIRVIASDTTYVTMRPLPDQEVTEYLDSGEWIGKAGAYAIQETADRFVVRVEGSFSNVVGLPMELVARMLAELGLSCGGSGGD
jgi:septum formation protein